MKKIETLSYLKIASNKEPCWENYEMIGTKEKDGKNVPNCVPKKEAKKKEYNPNPWAI